MILKIPQNDNVGWRGIFPSKFAGDFNQTFNMDLESVPGRMSLSGTSRLIASSDSDTSFSVPIKFIKHEADGTLRWWAITPTGLVRSLATSPSGAWSSDTITGSPDSDVQDAIIHGDSDLSDTDQSDRLLVSLKTTIAILHRVGALHTWDTDWWTAVDSDGGLGQSTLKSGDHSIARLQKLVAVGDQNKLHTIDRDDVVNFERLTFRDGYSEQCIYTAPNRFWIGLGQTNRKDEGAIIEWDGSSATYNKEYPFKGTPISGFVAAGIPYFINQYGQIMKLTGTSFEEFAHFPIFEENEYFDTGETFIGKYGIEVDGDIVKILVKRPITSHSMRSGVWILNIKNKNLYHHQAIGANTLALVTGDFGQGHLNNVGGMVTIKGSNTERESPKIMVGASHYTDYSNVTQTSIYGLYPNRGTLSSKSRGYFITPFIRAEQIQDEYQKLIAVFRKFVNTSNKIVLKFRTENALQEFNGEMLESTMSWLSDTHIRGSLATGSKIGHELEILNGINAGQNFHIKQMLDTNGDTATPNGSTLIDVTLDEVAIKSDTTGGLASLVVTDNWHKVAEFSDTDLTLQYKEFFLQANDTDDSSILNNATGIQFKVELRGKAVEVDRLLLVLKEHFNAE